MGDAGRLSANIPHVLDVEHFAQVTCGPGWSKLSKTSQTINTSTSKARVYTSGIAHVPEIQPVVTIRATKSISMAEKSKTIRAPQYQCAKERY